MKYYLVGGAVRDRLLGQPVRERDWLVVGGTPAALRTRGFRPVGKSFPVFLHPETGEEYSLPRGGEEPGEPEEAVVARDLAGRDLTVNAMALSPAGRLVDPLGGERDLRERLLRHTPAFEEDLVRVLRLARLLARYAPLGFRVAEETARLVTRLAATRAYRALPPDRVWAEIEQALTGERPRLFFEFLQERHAISPWLPELSALFGVPQPEIHHPEIDTGVHTLMVLDQACRLTGDPATRFAALCHDLGKGSTPREIWPRHAGHEKRSVHAITALCLRLPVPNRFKSLALLVAAYHTHCHRAPRLNPGTLLDTLAAADAFRRPERFEKFLTACEADARGRLGFEQSPYPQAALMRDALGAAAGVDAAGIARATGRGEQVAAAIWRARRQAIERMLERRADAAAPSP